MKGKRGQVKEAEEREEAQQLAQALGGLPLAFEQAAADVETGASFVDYWATYQRQPLTWLGKGSPETRGYPKSVATTWSLNFEAVERESKASADLFRCTDSRILRR